MATNVRRTAKWRALSARAQATYNAIERDRMSIALNRAERAIDDLQDQLAAQAVAK